MSVTVDVATTVGVALRVVAARSLAGVVLLDCSVLKDDEWEILDTLALEDVDEGGSCLNQDGGLWLSYVEYGVDSTPRVTGVYTITAAERERLVQAVKTGLALRPHRRARLSPLAALSHPALPA